MVLAAVVGVVLTLMGGFVAWRLWATHAGTRDTFVRVGARVEPVLERLEANQDPDPAQVERLASDRETRKILYLALETHGRLSVMPPAFATPEALAESDLVLWLMHPNELGAPPDEIERMAAVPAPASQGARARYFVFRFRTHEPQWAAREGWLAGIAGPYDDKGPIRAEPSGTFSRFESFEAHPPEEHVRLTLERLGIE